MTFLVIPAVDLKDGMCVRLVQGDPRFKTVELENPAVVAMRWEELGARRLHLIDLDGAIQGQRKNEEIVSEIVAGLGIPIQFGGGIRSFGDACRLLDLGIEKIILGTAAMENPELLSGLAEKYGPERLIVALDSKGGRVVTKGWVKDTGERAVEAVGRFEVYANEFLFTNVDVEGLVGGINLDIIKDVIASTRKGVIASGGVSSLDDIRRIKGAGASGVVIGTALYKGNIDFKEALSLERV